VAKERKFFYVTFFWFFLMTLNSFYFESLGMAVFSIFSALLSVPLIGLYRIGFKHYMKLPYIILFVVFFISLIGIFPHSEYVLVSRIPYFLLFIPVIFLSSYLLNEQKEMLFKILKISLIIHLLFFFVQFTVFYGTGIFIDFIEPVTGVAQRSLGGNYEINSAGDKLIRAAGLFNEPGTFATFIFLIFSLKKYLEMQLKGTSKLSFLDIMTLASVFLSFSVFGLVFCFVFILKYFLNGNLRTKIVISAVSLPLIILSYQRYLSVRFTKDADISGIGFREQAIRHYIDQVQEEPFNLLFGYSNFVDINKLFNVAIVWNDLGFLFNIMVNMGLIGLTLFLIIIVPRIKQYYLPIIVLCLCKLSITTVFLWFFFCYIFENKYSKR